MSVARCCCRALAILRLCLASEDFSPLQDTSSTLEHQADDIECRDPSVSLIATRVMRKKIIGDNLLPANISQTTQEVPEELSAAMATRPSANFTEASASPNSFVDANQTSLAANFSGVMSVLLDTNDSPPTARFDMERSEKNDGSYHAQPRVSAPQSPEIEEDVNKIRKHGLALSFVVPLASVIFVVFTLSNLMEKYGLAAAIPESLLIILIGVVLGYFLKYKAEWEWFAGEESYTEVMTGILNLVLLPILMFASGWSIRRQDFFSQFPYILLFAVVGVGLSTIVVAGLIYLTGTMKLHGVTTGRTAFAYAALISATDPVATLSTYTKLKVDPLLNILVFGESVINDAVAIVLFDVFNSDHFMLNTRGEHLTGLELLASVCWGVAKKFLTSVFFGVALGCLYTLIAHWADMRENKKGQILVILASCYLTYASAEVLHMSGIIAEIFCALLMGVYMRPLLSKEGSLLATFFVKELAALADACVFLLVGVSVNQLTYKGWKFGLWVMLFCLIGRFCAVYPLAYLSNFMKRSLGALHGVHPDGYNLLSPSHMFMMFHAGLRGAIALALVFELGKWVDDIDGAGTRRALQTATMLLIVIFLVIFGGSTSACLSALGIPMGQDMPSNALSKTEDIGGMRQILKWLDATFFSPILVGEVQKKSEKTEERDVEDVLREATQQS